MNPDFKLTGKAPDAPTIGDRYIRRDIVCEVIEVNDTSITVRVTGPHENFSRTYSHTEFPELRRRTLSSGAVFKPAAVSHSSTLQPFNSSTLES